MLRKLWQKAGQRAQAAADAQAQFKRHRKAKPPAPERPVDKPKTYPVSIVGESNYQEAIRECREGEQVWFAIERDNPFSKSGAAVAVIDCEDRTLGYLAEGSWLKRALVKERQEARAEIRFIGSQGGPLGVRLEVALGDGSRPRERAFADKR